MNVLAVETASNSTSCSQRDDARLFATSAGAVRQAWDRLCRRAGIENLYFHDLRHEAISRLFEMGLSVPEVALVSGHKTPAQLFRYTEMRSRGRAAQTVPFANAAHPAGEAPCHSLNGYQKACRNRLSLLGNSNLEHVCQR